MLAEELKKLSNVSEYLGKNLDLIQGAGGNTSVKINDVLWVKASEGKSRSRFSREL